MKTTFTTTISQAEGKNATGIQVPPEAVNELGTSKRPSVKVTLNGYSYQSTIAPMHGVFLIPFAAEHRAASGLAAGDKVNVTLELEQAPRTIEMPDDLAAALAEHPGLQAQFDALSHSRRKEHVRQVESAKAAETRARRIAAIVATLS